ncbi:phosphatase PAP2 family protein [Actinomadura opuntiae]|uniref:phosphatase PAP2 family protein n=1 Tax=Actinomadura sp. OS1-43 TaxID=604315 RepID=UPI00255A974C|nr:phosphatase PAP2 family protein [Actinomadura sp. OS1-43]MDL4818664.1 phosphatase PAP2 family protein [Actinomadura sp. OS1-43]
MLVAGPVCNALGKPAVGRDRPPRAVRQRRPGRVPDSGAFPSGHSAAASAFATAVALTAPQAAAPVTAAAAVVAYARVYTGAHYPGDVTAGTIAGIITAYALHRWSPAMYTTGDQP